MSSNAGLVSHFVNLQIVIPEATIQGTGSGEHHVDVGSVIDLVCIIEKVRKGPHKQTVSDRVSCSLPRRHECRSFEDVCAILYKRICYDESVEGSRVLFLYKALRTH